MTRKAPARRGNSASAAGAAVGPTGAMTGSRSQRQLRVAEEIRHVLSDIFARDMIHDPTLAGIPITVNEVRVSPDLRNATAFVSRLGRSDIGNLLPALRRAAPFLRAQVAKAIRLRVAPELSFQPDTALDYAVHVNAIMHRPDVVRDLAASAPDDSED